MILPDEIIVIGDDLEAEALRQVLRLRVRECHRYDYATMWGQPRDLTCLHNALDRSPLIIALSAGGSRTAQIIPMVMRLRTRLMWVGAFIAIVENAEEVEQLNVASLTGARQGRHLFGFVEGHAALSRPLLLSELYSTIGAVGEMHRHRWHGLVRQSSIPQLLDAMERGKGLVGGRDHAALAGAAKEVLDLALDLDWLTLLNEDYVHEGVHLVGGLQDIRAQSKPLSVGDCESIIKKVDHLVIKSCMGDDA